MKSIQDHLAPWDGPVRASERTVKSAERTIQLFEIFAAQQSPLAAGQITERLRAPQSSVARLLKNLVKLGYLAHDRSRKVYVPTVRTSLLGRWIEHRTNAQFDLVSRLNRLAGQCGERVVLGLQNGIYVQYICVSTVDVGEAMDVSSGMLRVLTHTGVGRALLCDKPDHEVMLMARNCNAEIDAQRRLKISVIMDAVRLAREVGYAETKGDLTAGISVIAMPIAPLFGNVPLAVGFGGFSENIQRKREWIIEALRDFQRSIEASSHHENASGHHEHVTDNLQGHLPQGSPPAFVSRNTGPAND